VAVISRPVFAPGYGHYQRSQLKVAIAASGWRVDVVDVVFVVS
jgi:hypothetical protein